MCAVVDRSLVIRTFPAVGMSSDGEGRLCSSRRQPRRAQAGATRGITVLFRDRVIDIAKPVDAYANCFVRRDHGTKNLTPTAPATPPPAGLALRHLDEDF